MTVAASLVSVIMRLFILPNRLVPGGFSGISSMMQYVFDIPAQYSMFAFNIPLLILALIFLKKDFAIKTLYATVMISVVLDLLNRIDFSNFYTNNLILDIFIGGILSGLSVHAAAVVGGSNGGTEIIAWLVHKKNPESDIGRFLFTFNMVVIGIGGFTVVKGTYQVWVVVYSLIYSFIGSMSYNLFARGIDPALRYVIITRKPREVYDAFSARFKRGATSTEIYEPNGEISDHTMLIVIIQNRQNIAMKRLLKKIDPGCFAYATVVDNVVTRPAFNRRYK